MSKPLALLAYQDADIEKQQIDAAIRTTTNRQKLNKLAKFIKQQQAMLTKLNDDMDTFSAAVAKIKLQYDMYYFENMSLLLDFQILVRTVYVVLTGKGAQ